MRKMPGERERDRVYVAMEYKERKVGIVSAV